MESSVVLSLVLVFGWIVSTTFGILSDVELMKLYETSVDEKEFVNNIFNLDAPKQLYVYEYLQDLRNKLEDDPKMKNFITSSLKMLQKKTDDFNVQHQQPKMAVDKFLQKRIDSMPKTPAKKPDDNKTTINLAKTTSQNLETPPPALKIEKKSDKSSSIRADSKKRVLKIDPEPTNTAAPKSQQLVKADSFAHLNSSTTLIRGKNQLISTSSKLQNQTNETPTTPPNIPRKSLSKSKAELARNRSSLLKENPSRAVSPNSTDMGEKFPPQSPSTSVNNSASFVKGNTPKPNPSNSTQKKKKSPIQSESKAAKIPSSSVEKKINPKISSSNSKASQIIQNSLPTTKSKSAQKEINSSISVRNEALALRNKPPVILPIEEKIIVNSYNPNETKPSTDCVITRKGKQWVSDCSYSV